MEFWGEIDPHISFEFEPLWSADDNEKAVERKANAETDAILIGSGVISTMESRKRVASDPDSGYSSIDVEDVSDLKDLDEDTLNEKPAKDDE